MLGVRQKHCSTFNDFCSDDSNLLIDFLVLCAQDSRSASGSAGSGSSGAEEAELGEGTSESSRPRLGSGSGAGAGPDDGTCSPSGAGRRRPSESCVAAVERAQVARLQLALTCLPHAGRLVVQVLAADSVHIPSSLYSYAIAQCHVFTNTVIKFMQYQMLDCFDFVVCRVLRSLSVIQF